MQNTKFKFDINEVSLDELKELMCDLYSKVQVIESNKKNKNGKKYSITPCMVGKKYREQDIRVMIIGQQANGWPKGDFSSGNNYSDDYIKKFFDDDRFDWIVQDADGRQHNIPEKGEKVYWLTRSNFWKWTRTVTEKILNIDSDILNGNKVERWQDYIAQSDTIKIGYANPDKNGKTTNISDWAIDIQKDICCRIIHKEIEILQPTHIIFVTGDDENKWFFNSLKTVLSRRDDDFVKLVGKINGAKTIVTVHPESATRVKKEKLKNNYEVDTTQKDYRLQVYAKECIKAFESIE